MDGFLKHFNSDMKYSHSVQAWKCALALNNIYVVIIINTEFNQNFQNVFVGMENGHIFAAESFCRQAKSPSPIVAT